MMRWIDERFKRLSEARGMVIAICAIVILGIADYLTGYELSLYVFYILPILFAAWYTSRRLAMLLAVLSTGVWLLAEIRAGYQYSRLFYFIWDIVTRLGFLMVLAYFMSENRNLLNKESALARTDELTGAANRRSFLEALDAELKRMGRYPRPMSLAYLDVDDFKQVNDRQGHDAGDRLLRSLTTTVRARIRSTDLIGRLGGDEFAILLPETGEREAREVIDDVRTRLRHAMSEGGWPVTFSIGLLTCHDDSNAVNEVLQTADRLMYEVKQAGKNSVGQGTVPKRAGGDDAAVKRRQDTA